MFDEFGINAGFVEELFYKYRQSPQSVEPKWRSFFESMGGADLPMPVAPVAVPVATLARPSTNGTPTNGPAIAVAPYIGVNGQPTDPELLMAPPIAVAKLGQPHTSLRPGALLAAADVQSRVMQLVNAYRVRGHVYARINPLGTDFPEVDELNLSQFGLSDEDLDSTFSTGGVAGLSEHATLRQIVGHLQETYCGSIGVEYTHLEDPIAREWLQQAMESTRNRCALHHDELIRILTKLTDAESFEQFVHRNFVGAKRFSCEGAESMIALLDLLIEAAAEHGVEEIVIGMAHRGRLNVLANVMDKNVREIFAAFHDRNPERFLGAGDVKYHLGQSTDRVTASGRSVHLSLAFNPSHLEFVNPVVEGRVRAKQDRHHRTTVMPLLIHGDAAFIGQGIVPETLNLAGVDGYATSGTIHLVVNNQIGFTTIPEDSRSTRYCTDITRMMKVPVLHVNGEDPEAVIQVARLAIEFRQRFGKDVVIDMYCYRRYGHNEGDEPRFTQPMMYKVIDEKPTVREVYVNKLLAAGQLTKSDADQIEQTSKAHLAQALEDAQAGDYLKPPAAMGGVWSRYVGGPDTSCPEVPTGVAKATLVSAIEKLSTIPEGFHAHPKVLRVIQQRRDKVLKNAPLDWGTAEHLAFATLLLEGRRIRLSGQDARRGTFTHRHSCIYDTVTGERHTPLAALGRGTYEVYDSPLSEAGVLGFEYGYSLDCPDGLVIWEAQFGDFANGAQVIIDQFISSAEDKWLRLSGLVLLLPHGYEGQGPEHSSARVERFLQLAAEDNMQICNLTTPAQFFHALRRQVLRPWRKPMVVFTPKSLLRHPQATSTVDELAESSFQRVIADASVDPKKVKKVLLCSGKVYYDLAAAREAQKRTDVAIIRLEQLYPLGDALAEALAPFADGTPLVWVQEEPANAGAWYFMRANLDAYIGERLPLSLVAREASASPATGSHAAHKIEQDRLVGEAFAI